ncbi:MAG TPA: hypothetical protein P5539_12365 [Mesotoga sp.]|nr:hypothetical protein [Mesotoga sp.]
MYISIREKNKVTITDENFTVYCSIPNYENKSRKTITDEIKLAYSRAKAIADEKYAKYIELGGKREFALLDFVMSVLSEDRYCYPPNMAVYIDGNEDNSFRSNGREPYRLRIACAGHYLMYTITALKSETLYYDLGTVENMIDMYIDLSTGRKDPRDFFKVETISLKEKNTVYVNCSHNLDTLLKLTVDINASNLPLTRVFEQSV